MLLKYFYRYSIISINEVLVVGKIFTAISIITDINLNSRLKSCFA